MKNFLFFVKTELIILLSRFSNNPLRHFVKELLTNSDKEEYVNSIAKQYNPFTLTDALSATVDENTYWFRSLLSSKRLRKLIKQGKCTEADAKKLLFKRLNTIQYVKVKEIIADLTILTQLYNHSYICKNKDIYLYNVDILNFLKRSLIITGGTEDVLINNVSIDQYIEKLKCHSIETDIDSIEEFSYLLTEKNIITLINACNDIHYKKPVNKLKNLFAKAQVEQSKKFNQCYKNLA